MSKRKKTSGGQAIVMVTVALIAMCGMMGLAVDLGWSFFVQKEAQAAADGAALAAVHEAWARLGGSIASVTCPNSPGGLYCQMPNPAPCSTFVSTSNLWNGCLYASNNGFASGGLSGRQQVTIQANVVHSAADLPPTGVTGIPFTNIAYWATVRTVQTVPQLFSAVLGNTEGTVSAIATAAVAAEALPGSFYGLNREGDCLTGNGSNPLPKFDCGVDMDLASSGNTTCYHLNGTSAGVTAKVCGPAGIYLASGCHGVVANSCTGADGTAGETQGNSANAWAESIIKIQNSGTVNDTSMWSPHPTNSSDSSLFQDPAHTKAQPPLVTPTSGTMGTCGLAGGVIPSGTPLGPLQYYSYTTLGVNGKPQPDGNPLIINKQAVTFSPSATGPTACPSGGIYTAPTGSAPAFPAYIFYGGLNINLNNETVNFGAGQYVMAGTNNQTGTVFTSKGGTVTGDSGTGTMFVFTDANYSGLAAQAAALPNALPPLYQGSVDLKNSNYALYGISQTASAALTDYQNYLLWFDRRNSTDTLNLADGSVITMGTPCNTCNVTSTSPQFILEPGNASMTMRGVSYQGEGAWINLQSGTANVATSHLQIITGALYAGNGAGSSAITLLGPDSPTIVFVTTLIQ